MAALGPGAGVARLRAGGFTLLELLVVIVLAGILLSVVTISATPDDRQQLLAEDDLAAPGGMDVDLEPDLDLAGRRRSSAERPAGRAGAHGQGLQGTS